MALRVVKREAERPELVLEIRERTVEAAHQCAGLPGTLSRATGVVSYPLDPGQQSPAARRSQLGEEPSGPRPAQTRRRHLSLGQVFGDGENVLVHVGREQGIQALERVALPACLDPERPVNEAVLDLRDPGILEPCLGLPFLKSLKSAKRARPERPPRNGCSWVAVGTSDRHAIH